ncbi:MAG: lipoprotein [Bacteroidaceae bacterium]|nr:lipoprotein [Bacteroidaceae bacterium]
MKNKVVEMRQSRYIFLFIVAIALLTGCTGRDNGSSSQPTDTDTLYTRQAAMR